MGYLRPLESCKAQGTKLIVGVDTDSPVARLKGPQRPVVPHEQRVQVLAGLEAADAVVIFEEDTPLKLIPLIEGISTSRLVNRITQRNTGTVL